MLDIDTLHVLFIYFSQQSYEIGNALIIIFLMRKRRPREVE